jgi:hypothetical protein
VNLTFFRKPRKMPQRVSFAELQAAALGRGWDGDEWLRLCGTDRGWTDLPSGTVATYAAEPTSPRPLPSLRS